MIPRSVLQNLLDRAADLVYAHSHNDCGAYAVDPDPKCCATCALEDALRKAHPEYAKEQKKRAAAPPGRNPNEYGRVVLGN